MFFTMPCPSCGKPLKGRDDLIGRTARCPYCRTSVTVQRPDEPAEEEAEAAPADAFNFAPKPGKPVAKAEPAAAADTRGAVPAAKPKAASNRPKGPPASAAAPPHAAGQASGANRLRLRCASASWRRTSANSSGRCSCDGEFGGNDLDAVHLRQCCGVLMLGAVRTATHRH